MVPMKRKLIDRKRLSHALASVVALSALTATGLLGCGQKFSREAAVTNTYVSSPSSASNSQTDDLLRTRYDITAAPLELETRPAAGSAAPPSKFAETIRSVVIEEFDREDLSRKTATVSFVDGSSAVFEFSVGFGFGSKFESFSESANRQVRFRLAGECLNPAADPYCESAFLELMELSTRDTAHLDFQRRPSYLNFSSPAERETFLQEVALEDPEKARALRGAAENTNLIVQHVARITGVNRVLKRLAITPLQLDLGGDGEDDTLPNTPAEQTTDAAPKRFYFDSDMNLPVTPDQSQTAVEPSLAPSTGAPPTVAPPKLKPTGRKAPRRVRMTLTEQNPFDVELPRQLFRNGNRLRQKDLGRPITNFEIVPVSMQKPFEPVFRMKVYAEQMFYERLKLPYNACNFYGWLSLRSAGYRIEFSNLPLANGFHQIFQSPVDGLNQWNVQETYVNRSSQKSEKIAEMERSLLTMPDHYATVLQIQRVPKARKKRTYGHVALLTRENGKVVMYDASYKDYKRGIKRRELQLRDYLKNENATIRLFSYPNLLQTARPVFAE
jgi:hypothetical protein